MTSSRNIYCQSVRLSPSRKPWNLSGVFISIPGTIDALPCHIHFPVCLWIMDSQRTAPKKNTSHGNEVLLQNTTHLMQRPCYQQLNKEVRAKIQQAIGPHKDLLTIVKRRKLQWYDHVSRSSGLAKTVLQGTVKGGRRQGRQRKKWENIIRESTGLEFSRSNRAVKNRGKWRKLVVKSFVVPQQPSRLRDRWDENSKQHVRPNNVQKRGSNEPVV